MIGLGGCFLVCGGLLETRDSTQYTKMHSIAPPTAKNDLQPWPMSKAGADGAFPELPKAEAKSNGWRRQASFCCWWKVGKGDRNL